MEIITADKIGTELGIIRDLRGLDVRIGVGNDFVITVDASSWSKDVLSKADHWYTDDCGEIGGKIGCIRSITGSKQIQLMGYTWRGLLDKKIIEPDADSDYKVVSGGVDTIIKNLIEPCFDGLFVVPDSDVPIAFVMNYKFKRYTTLLSGIETLLKKYDLKLDIHYEPGKYSGGTFTQGHVVVRMVDIVDYSSEIEFSQDGKIDFTAEDYRMGVNHLICLGKGELKNRQVVHLYSDADGNISDKQTLFGVDEIAAVYDYPSAESLDDLKSYGTQKAKELGNTKSLKISLNKVEARIGDIVGGEEQITGITLKKQISEIIVKVDSKGKLSITHKVGD